MDLIKKHNLAGRITGSPAPVGTNGGSVTQRAALFGAGLRSLMNKIINPVLYRKPFFFSFLFPGVARAITIAPSSLSVSLCLSLRVSQYSGKLVAHELIY